ncbi:MULTISPECIES: preprotein translocase subunit SecE [unclassified Sedimentibacter]|uniref:preprotein translocase subunit SecE n=1 Tax=unclassified Sedimentibacter TaxID=2649220 RepID=UPI001BD24787|nr:preprotein translocase subunit SecE [Sedimentibacter sp. MB35-C1]WMJ76636.1 preprotein translocase subunit SecE [Sedimentibacter sp. MB35-C1]
MSNRENEKPKFTARVSNYFKGVKAELKKVNWPTKKELTNYTVVVLATTFTMTLVIWGLDLIFQNLVALIV